MCALRRKICRAANPLRFPPVMPCSYQHPTGFIVLCESIRNGKKHRSPVQQLHALVNHRMVHRVRPTAKIFTDFTSIDLMAAKLSRLCTARYGKTDFCTLLYTCFVYQPSVQRQILHSTVKCFTASTSKMVFKNGIKNSRTECTACTAILKSGYHFQYGGGLITSMPTNPRTRLPPTWTLLVASTL